MKDRNWHATKSAISGPMSGIFAFAVGVVVAGAVQADIITPVYSFEPGLEGFGPNGGGITVTQDTIGATDGTSSMKVSVVAPAFFVGANTPMLHPAIGDPPGLDHVLFDLTVTDQYEGAFAVVGVMVFGVNQAGQGRQVQTGPSLEDPTLEFHIEDLTPGTYTDILIDMSRFFHPDTFEPGTFNDIFGAEGSGPNDIIPTSLQLYFNKSTDAPLNVYIDNIRVGTMTEGLPGDYNGDNFVDAADYTVWRNNLSTNFDLGGNGNESGGSAGVVDEDDYTWWKQHYGTGGGPGSGGVSHGVPEPSSLLLFATGLGLFGINRGRRKL